MMATVILSIFVIVLLGAMARAIYSPALAVVLGMSTFGLEQIASIVLPLLSVHQSAFNILIAVVLAASLTFAVHSGFVLFETNDGFDVALLLFAFLAFLMLSIIWSPAADLTWAAQQMPYFAVYVGVIPMLVQRPPEMLKSFRVLWFILAIGLLGTILSPNLLFSIAAARVVIGSGIGEMDLGANPLAFADTAIMLALISILFLLRALTQKTSSVILRTIAVVGSVSGIAMGVSLAFVSGRGETVAGLVSGVTLIVLIVSRSSGSMLGRLIAATTVCAGALVFAFVRLQDAVASIAPRFTISNLLEGASVRADLQGACVDAGLATTSTLLFGIGANGCQVLIGLYPHNELIQAFSETGIIGLTLLLTCYYFTVSFAFQTLSLAKQAEAQVTVQVCALAISFLIYALLVANKRGTLTVPNTYMWIALVILICDRAQASLRPMAQVST